MGLSKTRMGLRLSRMEVAMSRMGLAKGRVVRVKIPDRLALTRDEIVGSWERIVVWWEVRRTADS